MPEEVPTYTMDDLADLFPEDQEQEKGRKGRMLAAGFYNTIPKLTSRMTTVEKGDQKGRRIVRFFGEVKGAASQSPANQDAAGKTGRVGFGVSWQVVIRPKDSKTDGPSSLYLDAQDLYNDSHGLDRSNKPSVKQVLEFLENYPVGLFITQGQTDNWVNRISAPKE